MTQTERILARAAGRRSVQPGDELWAKVDLVVMHDSSGPRRIIPILEQLGGRVWDPSRVVLAIDHFTPAATLRHAEILTQTRRWAREHGVAHFFDGEGILHNLLLEEGIAQPGMFIVGADSHTLTAGACGAVAVGVGSTELAVVLATGEIWVTVPPTVLVRFDDHLPLGVAARDMAMAVLGRLRADFALNRAVEFAGSAVRALNPEERSVLTNQAVEMGAENGIVAPDDLTALAETRPQWAVPPLEDGRAEPRYEQVYTFDADELVPMVALPPSVDNARPVSEVEGQSIDRAYLGSCAGAKYADLAMAARILRGRRVRVPLTVVPATRRAYQQALADGTLAALVEAGATVQAPGCGACAGLHSGVLGPGERCIATVTRNFPGRMGHPSSEVYLASPYTVAASAVTGAITDPRQLLDEEEAR